MRCNTSLFEPAYFQRLFSSQGVADLLNLSSIGATMANLNAGMVARLKMPCPPRDEQSLIVGFIHEAQQRHGTAISRLEREIELLREYRTRLIADVVTGKLDVREAAASLHEEAAPDVAEASDETELTDEEIAV
jgi:type I restriction enzyme S subunit